MATVAYGSLPFEEQIAFFRAKRGVLTESWLDVFGAEHDVAFMVAGANRGDLLADLRDAIDRAIADGATLEEFRKQFDDIVATHGWNYKGGRNWRSRVIYETNLRQSYNAGRWQQLQQLKRVRPYWQYKHSDAVMHPRPMHLSWDGLVLHADDPWWHTHFPANGWGCQCYVQALSERDLTRLGKSGPDRAPPIEWDTVTIGQRSPGGPRLVQTPQGIDPGFGYAPGRSLGGGPAPTIPRTPPSLVGQLERAVQHALETTTRLPVLPAAQTVQQILAVPRGATAIDEGYAAWQTAVLASRKSRNLTYLVGALDGETVAALQADGIEALTAAIVARDVEVLRALRTITAEDLARLPALLRAPRAVLLQVTDRRLLYVVDAGGSDAAQLAIAVRYPIRADGGSVVVNSFRSAGLTDLGKLQSDVNAGRLVLLRGTLE